MSPLLFAGLKGMTAYLNFTIFNNRMHDAIAHMVIGGLLVIVLLVFLWAVCQWMAKHRWKLTGFTLVGLALVYFIQYQN